MGPTWVLSAPDGPHVGPMNLAIRVETTALFLNLYQLTVSTPKSDLCKMNAHFAVSGAHTHALFFWWFVDVSAHSVIFGILALAWHQFRRLEVTCTQDDLAFNPLWKKYPWNFWNCCLHSDGYFVRCSLCQSRQFDQIHMCWFKWKAWSAKIFRQISQNGLPIMSMNHQVHFITFQYPVCWLMVLGATKFADHKWR